MCHFILLLLGLNHAEAVRAEREETREPPRALSQAPPSPRVYGVAS